MKSTSFPAAATPQIDQGDLFPFIAFRRIASHPREVPGRESETLSRRFGDLLACEDSRPGVDGRTGAPSAGSGRSTCSGSRTPLPRGCRWRSARGRSPRSPFAAAICAARTVHGCRSVFALSRRAGLGVRHLGRERHRDEPGQMSAENVDPDLGEKVSGARTSRSAFATTLATVSSSVRSSPKFNRDTSARWRRPSSRVRDSRRSRRRAVPRVATRGVGRARRIEVDPAASSAHGPMKRERRVIAGAVDRISSVEDDREGHRNARLQGFQIETPEFDSKRPPRFARLWARTLAVRRAEVQTTCLALLVRRRGHDVMRCPPPFASRRAPHYARHERSGLPSPRRNAQ